MQLWILATIWIMWCTIHSGLICLSVTDYFRRSLGRHYRFYRLIYNVISFSTIVPIIWYGTSLHSEVILCCSGVFVFALRFFGLISLVLFGLGARHYDLLQLIGIRQIMTAQSHKALTRSGELDTAGILAITRHPWYLGAMLFIWSIQRCVTVADLVRNIILTVYLIVGTLLEERKLVLEFGETYRRYQKEVSMLLPFAYVRAKIKSLIE